MFQKSKSVNAILSAFTKTISDLQTLSEVKEEEAVQLTVMRDSIEEQIEEASNESFRARSVAAKLDMLLSADLDSKE